MVGGNGLFPLKPQSLEWVTEFSGNSDPLGTHDLCRQQVIHSITSTVQSPGALQSSMGDSREAARRKEKELWTLTGDAGRVQPTYPYLRLPLRAADHLPT